MGIVIYTYSCINCISCHGCIDLGRQGRKIMTTTKAVPFLIIAKPIYCETICQYIHMHMRTQFKQKVMNKT